MATAKATLKTIQAEPDIVDQLEEICTSCGKPLGVNRLLVQSVYAEDEEGVAEVCDDACLLQHSIGKLLNYIQRCGHSRGTPADELRRLVNHRLNSVLQDCERAAGPRAKKTKTA